MPSEIGNFLYQVPAGKYTMLGSKMIFQSLAMVKIHVFTQAKVIIKILGELNGSGSLMSEAEYESSYGR